MGTIDSCIWSAHSKIIMAMCCLLIDSGKNVSSQIFFFLRPYFGPTRTNLNRPCATHTLSSYILTKTMTHLFSGQLIVKNKWICSRQVFSVRHQLTYCTLCVFTHLLLAVSWKQPQKVTQIWLCAAVLQQNFNLQNR